MTKHLGGALRRWAVLVFCTALATGTIFWGPAVRAETEAARSSEPLIVRNDRGGLLQKRLRELNRLHRTGQPVRIEGGICYSTCTMFLGLPQTCVSPDTTFGFHGPSSYGRPLDPALFERASQLIAQNYPPALQRWYMDTGRYKTRTLYRIRGEQIIALGIEAC